MPKSTLFAAKVTSWTVLRDILKRGDNFHNNGKTFTGERWENAFFPGIGWMDNEEYETLKTIHDNVGIDYVIRSYDTVIAYRAGGEWYVSHAKYSRTTTQHQSTAAVAISALEREMSYAGN